MDFTGRTTVFVYGTLMQGFPNEITISQFPHEVYPARISDVELYDTGTFPAMVRGKHTYLGELIVFDSSVNSKEVFSHLDRLICGNIKNSENSLYVKESVTVINLKF